jgi:opacity protein-like surface antigen
MKNVVLLFVLLLTQNPLEGQVVNDPWIMKVYSDGGKKIVRQSEAESDQDYSEVKKNESCKVIYDPNLCPTPPKLSVPESRNSEQSNFYFSPKIGPAIVQDINFDSFAASAQIAGITVGTNQSPYLSTATGLRFDFSLGYQFNDWCSMEFSPGVLWNPLKAFGDNDVTVTIDGETYTGSGELNLDGSFLQIPLMVNILFYIPTGSSWRPMIGGGIGGNYNYLNFSKILGVDLSDASGACWSMGYQAIAGFEYEFEEGYSVGLKYIFMGSTSQSFNSDLSMLNSKGSFSQSVVLDLKASF